MRKKTIQSMELETWKIGKLMSSNNLQCAPATPPPPLYITVLVFVWLLTLYPLIFMVTTSVQKNYKAAFIFSKLLSD